MQDIKIIYFNTVGKPISTHTFLKKNTLTIKDIFIPAFYVGAKSFVIISKSSQNLPVKKIQSVSKLFEINFLGCKKLLSSLKQLI